VPNIIANEDSKIIISLSAENPEIEEYEKLDFANFKYRIKGNAIVIISITAMHI
jgi:hypothetical protein